MAFSFANPEEQRLTRPRLSIPALTASLMGSGQTPESQPFYAALPPELQDLFRTAARQYGGPIQTPYGSETNRGFAQSILGSPGYQSAAQPQQGHILDLVQAVTAGQAPGLTQALGQAPMAPPGSPGMPTTPTAAPAPASNPTPAPQTTPAPQPPPDPYAPWGGYSNYLLWLYGLGPDKGGGPGGGDTGVGGSGGPGAGGPGGGGGGAEGGGD